MDNYSSYDREVNCGMMLYILIHIMTSIYAHGKGSLKTLTNHAEMLICIVLIVHGKVVGIVICICGHGFKFFMYALRTLILLAPPFVYMYMYVPSGSASDPDCY